MFQRKMRKCARKWLWKVWKDSAIQTSTGRAQRVLECLNKEETLQFKFHRKESAAISDKLMVNGLCINASSILRETLYHHYFFHNFDAIQQHTYGMQCWTQVYKQRRTNKLPNVYAKSETICKKWTRILSKDIRMEKCVQLAIKRGNLELA